MTVAYKNHNLSQAELYNKLRGLYDSNGYYEENNYDSNSSVFKTKPHYIYRDHIKPLRTCVNRSVEFYVSKIATGIEIGSNDEKLISYIEQVLLWSNFSSNKSVSIRNEALYGNLYWKVSGSADQIYFDVIKTQSVTDLVLNSRGFIQEIRIDIPVKDDFNRNLTYTEYWSKTEGYFATWEHSQGANAPLDTLGDPIQKGWLEELGIDFIPFVHVKFKDLGDTYGMGSVFHALDKIDEANKQASRLSDLVFRYGKPVISISSNDKDSMGRPVPAPKVDSDTDIFSKEDESILYLNGMATVNSLIPDINYGDALLILNSMVEELNEDLPELRYYSLKEGLSGKSVKALLGGAFDRAVEAQANFVGGLKRIIQMGLTLGIYWGLFTDIGKFENGDFDFEIITPEMFAVDDEQKSKMLKEYVESGLPLQNAMEVLGFSKDFIASVMKNKEGEAVEEDTEIIPSSNVDDKTDDKTNDDTEEVIEE